MDNHKIRDLGKSDALVVLSQRRDVVIGVLSVLFTLLLVSDCLNSGIDNVSPHRWDHSEVHRGHVLEWIPRSVIKPAEDLVWAEGMSVMVRVPLNSEGGWRSDGIPRMEHSDRFVDSILIFFSLKTVVLNKVNDSNIPEAEECVHKLVHQGGPSEEMVDNSQHDSVHDKSNNNLSL